MNSKVSNARKILFSLKEKYCADNLKNSKTVLSSSEELSSDDEVNPKQYSVTKAILSSEQESVRSSASGKRDPIRKVDIDSNAVINLVKQEDPVSVLSSNISTTSLYNKPLPVKSILSDSVVSSVKTDVKSDAHTDIEEDYASEVSAPSSNVNILANVHVLSDDVLEDVETNFGSDRSDVEDGRSTRLSAGHSIKSIQLGSPITPPNADAWYYESDFQDSDNESIKSEQSVETVEELDETEDLQPIEIQPALKLNEYILENANEDITHSETYSGLHLKHDSSNDNGTKPNKDFGVSERQVKEKEIKIVELSNPESSSKHSSSNYSSSNRTVSNEKELTKIELPSNSESSSNHSLLKYNSSDRTTRDEEEYTKKESPSNSVLSNKNSSSNYKSSYRTASEEEELTNKESPLHSDSVNKCTFINVKNVSPTGNEIRPTQHVGVNVKLHDSPRSTDSLQDKRSDSKAVKKKNVKTNTDIIKTYISTGVQTHYLSPRREYSEESIPSYKRKKIFIKTSVKSTKQRPIITASSGKFNFESTDLLDDNYNPSAFITQISEGTSVEEIINETIRNQIAMTRYFMNCHHSLYMQCCQAVQSMNKEYKKEKICVITTT